MADQVGARFLAESEIWRAWEKACSRKGAKTQGGSEGAVAPLAETAAMHMPVPVQQRFLAWWWGLPSTGRVDG